MNTEQPTVAKVLVEALRADGYSVQVEQTLRHGTMMYRVTATDPTGQRWVAYATTRYWAVYEVAVALGWEFD